MSPLLYVQFLPEPPLEWSTISDVIALAKKVACTLYDTAKLAKPPSLPLEQDLSQQNQLMIGGSNWSKLKTAELSGKP